MIRTIGLAAIGCVMLVLPSGAMAQNMPVSTFLAKADALQAKGMMAMFSSDISLLKTEMNAASNAYRGSPASKAPQSCPPPKGTARFSSDDVLASFRTIPAAQQARTTVAAAFSAMMQKRFPCR